jgi:hypothetical protein
VWRWRALPERRLAQGPLAEQADPVATALDAAATSVEGID